MSNRRKIVVIGATGAQGSGLVRAIHNGEATDFTARAITRDIHSQKAEELRKLGAEVVAADVDDAGSLEEAFEGAYGAFCVTFFWEHFSPEKEITQVENMVKASKKRGLKHVIWSTLEDTRKWVPLEDERMPTLMGRYKVPHFDAKGEADHLFSDAEIPTTFLLTSFYWDNLIHFGMGPKRGPDGKLSIILPMGNKKLPGIAAEDIGKCAYGIFKEGDKFIGRRIGVAGEQLTGEQMAAGLTRALGQEVRHQDISPEEFRRMGFPGAQDLGNMFQFKQDFERVFCGARDPEFARSINPSLQDFETWLSKNWQRIPLE